ncbi:hypothetical protein C8Q74DRAFT_1373210 [Fomes fomentarius]|nr:hypothetical protein C8Q74DRAFT_1303596 [Fomes fomentarius]KAI0758178.1 hypothetical protein C8Q74DRAFT_1373210 [Fomes fomentarius]
MGQSWDLLNIDDKEKSPEICGKLFECFFETHPSLLYSLRLPVLPRQVDTWLRTGKHARQPGPLGKLSPELLDMIFDNIFFFWDIIQFSITCKLTLEVGKRHLLSALRRYHAPWAGQRLICLGGDPLDSDLPKGLLTPFEQREILTSDIPIARELRLAGEEMYLAIYACETYLSRYGTLGRADRLQRDYWEGMRKKREEVKDHPQSNRDLDMFHALYIYSKPTYPKGSLVCCNLSKAEYIRQDRLRKMEWEENWQRNRYKRSLGLAHALIVRICWSGDSPLYGAKGINEQLAKGPWAGDRFSITTLETMPQPKDAKEWKDVTAEVDELLFRIWEYFFQ